MSFPLTTISKTAFLKYDQCAKAFFLYKKFNHLRDKPSKEKELLFSRGHFVGKLAQQLFPGGIDVSEGNNTRDAFLLTQDLLQKNHPVIYEATFIHNSVLVMVDILALENGHYSAYEVKSSLKVSETYVKDACLQYYVLKNSLPNFSDLFLVTINGDYKLQGELNIKQLFKRRSVKIDAEKNLNFFEAKASEMLLLLDKNTTPDIFIGKHCFSPYECEFMGTCWKNRTDPKTIFNIGKVDKEQLFNWYKEGFHSVDLIPEDPEMKPSLSLQIAGLKNEKEYLNLEEIEKFVSKVKAPYCFLDMEIWSPAIPQYQGTSPFEQIPFLFSVAFSNNGENKLINYMKPIDDDGRLDFLENVMDALKPFESILVYDKNLEMQVLNSLRSRFPQYSSEIETILKKLIDISEPVLNFHYYHPGFKGSFSLKAIAESVVNEPGYTNSEIPSGIVAMYAYESLLTEKNPIVAETIKQQLIDYCNLDTLVSLKFFEFLKEKIKE